MAAYKTETYRGKDGWGYRVTGPKVWAQSGTRYMSKRNAAIGAERWIKQEKLRKNVL